MGSILKIHEYRLPAAGKLSLYIYRMKPLKNIDSAHRTLILKTFCTIFPLTGLLLWAWLGIVGVLIAVILCTILAFSTVNLAGGIGGVVGKLYSGRQPIWNVQERYAAELSRTRVQKMKGNHKDALMIIETVLDEKPAFNEALLLKAQILAEGFGDNPEAKKCLAKILQTEPKNTQLYHWCQTLYTELATQNE
jgi:tetratricopeptide (TPR) repeat protein